MATPKAKFAALPLRAISDSRLSGLELRTLGCIAWHDRMSSATGKGQGAWASNATMAQRLDCHLTNLSSAITTLAKLGYITREQHHFDKRMHVYRVAYEAADSLPDGKPNTLPDGQRPGSDSLPDDQRSPEIVCPASEIDQRNECVAEGNIFRETVGRYSAEAVEETPLKRRVADAPRAASVDALVSADTPINTRLAIFEREWKRDWTQFRDNLSAWRDWLYGEAEGFVGEDDIASARAQRLAEEIDGWISYLGWENSAGEVEL